MKIGNSKLQQNGMVMNKSIKKFVNASIKKFRQQKERIKKLRFSTYKEDFVITEQEEREGGYFGGLNLKYASR